MSNMSSASLAPYFRRAVSPREGNDWMDGHPCLMNMNSMHTRPWNGCIEIDRLSVDNLPPLYVRLRDDQAMSLQEWAFCKCKEFSKTKLGHFWPHDFGVAGQLLASRSKWGKSKADTHMPLYRNLRLGRTFTSSGKIMLKDLERAEEARLDKVRVDFTAKMNKSDTSGNSEQEIKAVQEELNARNQAIEKLNDELRSTKAELDQARVDIAAEMKKSDAAASLEQEIQAVQEVLEARNQTIENLNNELRSVKAELDQARVNVATEMNGSNASTNPGQEIQAVQEELEARNQAIERLNNELRSTEAELNQARVDVAAEMNKSDACANLGQEIQAAQEELEARNQAIEKLNDELRSIKVQLEQKDAQTKRIWERDDLEEIPSRPEKKAKYFHHPDSAIKQGPTTSSASPHSSNSNSSNTTTNSTSTIKSTPSERAQRQQMRAFCADYADLHAQWEAYDRDKTESLLASCERERRHAELRDIESRHKLSKIKKLVCELAPETAIEDSGLD